MSQPPTPLPPRPTTAQLLLPPADPGLLAAVGEDRLRWLCLYLFEELQAGPLAHLLPEDSAAVADLGGEFSQLVVYGLQTGERARAVIAYERIIARHGGLHLDTTTRAAWLAAWSARLDKTDLPRHRIRQLEHWMSSLTEQWLGASPATVVVFKPRPH